MADDPAGVDAACAGVGEGLKSLVAHSDRFWKAEEVNAARLAARSNLVLSAITAVLGLKLFAMGKEMDTVFAAEIGWRSILFWQAAVGSIGCLLWSLCIILGIKKKDGREQPDTSSGNLGIDELLGTWKSKTNSQVVEYVMTTTYDAAIDLQARNADRKRSIGRSQIRLFFAIGLLFASMGLYTSLRLDDLRRAERLDGGSNDSNDCVPTTRGGGSIRRHDATHEEQPGDDLHHD